VGQVERVEKLPEDLARKVRFVIEFHRWGGTPEGVTDRETLYTGSYSSLRQKAIQLSELCDKVVHHLGKCLPDDVETLIAAGRMYRRAADYAKAVEYFLKALELIYKVSGCA